MRRAGKCLVFAVILLTCVITKKADARAATDSTIAGIDTVTPASQLANAAADTADTAAAGTAQTETTAQDNAGLITVDLVIFAGQSNMSGAGGNLKDAPSVPNGHGYEYRQGKCAAGLYTVEEPFGIYSDGYLCDPDGLRTGSLVSSFMNTYYKKTNVPVLGVSAARGGTSVTFWSQPEVQKDLLYKYLSAKSWCAANNVRIRHQYVVWLQGETDAIACMSAETYENALENIFAQVIGQGIEQVFVITIGNFAGLPGAYDVIVAAQKQICVDSPYFTLGTDVLHTLPETCTPDTVHYDQKSLNQAGSLCATTCAAYSLMKR